MNYYPAFLNLKGKKAVVVGGGNVAERKVLTLIKANANVTVISPVLTKRLQKEKEAKRLRHISRAYRYGDLQGSFLVIAATDSPELNTKVAQEAPGLLNVVDVPAECNFIAPSVVKRGPLVLAISTGGTSPAFAKAIRKEIEKSYGKVFSDYLGFVKVLRSRAMQEISDKKSREKFLKSLASGELLDTLRRKGLDTVKKSVMVRFNKLAVKKQ
jgi:precorrin-2 dehydrogenase/sirohydrochlorin ferrochelatase